MDTIRHSLRARVRHLLPFIAELDALILQEEDGAPRPSLEGEPDVVSRLRHAVADSGLALYDFDWIEWERKRRVCWDRREIRRADLDTVRKILTAHVRADRYFAGHLEAACRRGVLSTVLRRLESLAAHGARQDRWHLNSPAPGGPKGAGEGSSRTVIGD